MLVSKALLLSGGMDSLAIAYWKRPKYAFTIDYGQRCAKAEIRTSAHICSVLKIEHEIITVDCSSLGSGDLSTNEVNKYAPSVEWWPYRNQLLITLGVMKAISLDVDEIFIGSVKSDSGHIDGRKGFFESISSLVEMQEGGLRITAPAIDLDPVDLVKISEIGKELLCWAHSCHTGDFACGVCRGCNKHRTVMSELGYGNY